MSRSYKKNTCSNDVSFKEDKKMANRKLRREKIDYFDEDYKDTPNYKSYKKKKPIKEEHQQATFNMSFEEYKEKRLSWWEKHHKENDVFPSDKELQRDYYTLYVSK